MVKDTDKNTFSELRLQAQTLLAGKPELPDTLQGDVQKLIHELDTYQIELELQNEELRSTQEELEKSRHRYADLYDFAPIAYLTVSDKGLILEANLTAGDMLGVARAQLLNRPFSEFIVTEDQDLFYLHRKKLLETRMQQSYQIRIQKKDGSFFLGLVEAVIRGGSSDPPGQFLLMVNDISAHKEIELARLRRLKNRYQAIVMDQNEMICRFDPQGRITFVNDAYCRYFSVSHTDLVGRKFMPNFHEDDVHLVGDLLKSLTPQKPDKTIELRAHLGDGTMVWQQWCGRAIYDNEENVLRYQAVGRDITKIKQAEEKLQNETKLRQLFLDALPCIAMLLQFDTREIVASNKAAVAVGAVPGMRCYTSWIQRDHPCTWCLAPEIRSTKEPLNNQFWALGIYWDAYWVPVTENFYLHYLFDITEKERNREALNKINEELEQRVMERTLELQQSHAQLLHSEKLAAIGKLAASIAHEFNNPLQSVMTIVQGIEEYSPLEDKEKHLLTLALQECSRMKNLIADLRDFFQPTSGATVHVDLHALLDGLLLISKKDYSSRNIKIIKKYGNDVLPVMAVADQLKQVFINLLNNAADACENGGTITLTTQKIGEHIAVHIEDNGKGIVVADIDHIFEPFFTTKPELKGTGLGLSVSYGIIKQHGGRIDVKSEPGKGSTFSVLLPIESANNDQ
ncbi:PAS domain S-box protein [Desulforhopalus sp. IMCC35007]|uniref:sensor histidine kinase n=1 Tax=Desulforhopalus sp. IMCC35007 TaxID=2569543 RepID=UPI0010AE4944|nr:PAS domain S-box protein [Desulforhopalus sp. IMCC35007]TKB06363.1 PAS domain S-box protein [Desulforhopalus sp. IMCC35007]